MHGSMHATLGAMIMMAAWQQLLRSACVRITCVHVCKAAMEVWQHTRCAMHA